MRKPTSGQITFPYGATTYPYSSSNPHSGVDYGAKLGDNVYAPHAGKVTFVGSLGDCGLGIDIDGGRFKSRLCHNSSFIVSVGKQVAEGEVVARAGASGKALGVHSHWVLWDNGVRVDGSKYLTNNGGNMAKFTKEQINAISRMATFEYPGAGFDYNKYTSQEVTSAGLDQLINEFVPYSEKKIAEYKALQDQVSNLPAAKILASGFYKVN